jgi:hypothetical protein
MSTLSLINVSFIFCSSLQLANRTMLPIMATLIDLEIIVDRFLNSG